MIIFFNVIVMKNIVRKLLTTTLIESFNIEKSIINAHCFKVVSKSSMPMKNVKLWMKRRCQWLLVDWSDRNKNSWIDTFVYVLPPLYFILWISFTIKHFKTLKKRKVQSKVKILKLMIFVVQLLFEMIDSEVFPEINHLKNV